MVDAHLKTRKEDKWEMNLRESEWEFITQNDSAMEMVMDVNFLVYRKIWKQKKAKERKLPLRLMK